MLQSISKSYDLNPLPFDKKKKRSGHMHRLWTALSPLTVITASGIPYFSPSGNEELEVSPNRRINSAEILHPYGYGTQLFRGPLSSLPETLKVHRGVPTITLLDCTVWTHLGCVRCCLPRDDSLLSAMAGSRHCLVLVTTDKY